MSERAFLRRNQNKGNAYSLEQFATRYDLADEQAEDLFYRFGPSAIELDILMAANNARRRELPLVGE